MADRSGKRQEPMALTEELKLINVGLTHHTPHDFFRSQWQSEVKSCVFLVYRWILAVFFGTGLCSFLVIYFIRGTVFIYLTTWGFTLCSLTSISGAIFTSLYHANTELMVNRSSMIKWYWACYWTNLILAHVIAFVYWTVMYYRKPPMDLISRIYDVWIHGLPVVLLNVDHMLVAHPTRVLHMIYPFYFGLGYLLFTYIYYLCGGLSRHGTTYIYRMLDFDNLGLTSITIVFITIFIMGFSIMQYGVYRLRVCIARRLNKLL
ncbi:hypothetical protein KR093_011635 [Drosophila rubida]|uniref:Protein rolling stone n=1 Tax=Drosophila rubida TaxID=30044 RepID=A0AAD4PLZ2_9MUSC|nr:hypothetical protein KR093_011635 [Drosophila rubida]